MNIVVGTSPISLAKAIFLKSEDKEVSILDKRSEVGGCWQISSYKEMHFDLGCHFLVPFENEEENTKLIQILKLLDISAELCAPSALFERKIEEISDYTKDHIYIKVLGGYSNIVRTLHQQIKNFKIPILIDNIKSITVDQNNVSLFGNEKQYKARNVFIPSYCDVQKIKVIDKTFNLECDYQDSQHLVILANGSWKKNHYDYYFLEESEKFTFDKLTTHTYEGNHLFNIRIGREHKLKSDRELLQLAKKFMANLGYEINNIIFSNRHIYEFPFRSEAYVRDIQKKLNFASNGKLKMIYTRNFTKALLEAYS